MENQIDKILEKGQFVLDLSFLPRLRHFRNTTAVFYVPEEVITVFEMAQQNDYYKRVARDLLRVWTRQRDVEITAIGEELLFLLNRGIIKSIEEKDCDKEILNTMREHVWNRRLWTELSPKQNLLGQIVGKIVGFAKKSGM